MWDVPYVTEEKEPIDTLPDEFLFLISVNGAWYGDFILYLQTQWYEPNSTCDERHRIRHQAKYYLIFNDTLYHRGVDSILWCCRTHEEDEIILNDCHSGACGGHLFGLATTHKMLEFHH